MIRINKHTVIGSVALSCLLAISIGIVIKHKTSTTRKTENVKLIESEKNEFFNKQQVIEDIDFALNTIKNYHISCIKEVPQEVLQQKDIEIANLQETTSTIEVWKILSRIFAKFHDVRTTTCWPEFLRHKMLSLKIHNVNNRFFCDDDNYKGAEIIAINKTRIADLYKSFKKHFSFSIEEWPHGNFFDRTFFPAGLLALSNVDITQPVEISFKTNQGVIEQKYRFYEQKLVKEGSLVSYLIDEEKNLGIFHIGDFDQSCDKIVNRFFADIEKNNIKNIVIDWRFWRGSDIAIDFFKKYIKNFPNSKKLDYKVEKRIGEKIKTIEYGNQSIEEINKLMSDNHLFDGNIYILISNENIGAGLDFACFFSDNDLAMVIGEIPGNSPTCFCGDKFFSSPNSHVTFRISSMKFYRPDPTKDPIRFTPDILVKAEDAMNEVYKLIKK